MLTTLPSKASICVKLVFMCLCKLRCYLQVHGCGVSRLLKYIASPKADMRVMCGFYYTLVQITSRQLRDFMWKIQMFNKVWKRELPHKYAKTCKTVGNVHNMYEQIECTCNLNRHTTYIYVDIYKRRDSISLA